MMLVEEGCHVILISSRPRTSIQSAVCWEVVNLEDKEKIQSLTNMMDSVDHCCFLAAKKQQSEGSGNVRTVNRLIDRNSSDAFVNSKCPSAVYISGLSIFQSTPSETITEDSIPKPPDDYTQSKLAGEKYFGSTSHRQGKTLRILRLNAPYGPGMIPNAVVHKFISRAIADKALILHGDGSREQHFTWVGDCCRAIRILLRRAGYTIFAVQKK
jgi:nucleoside-diphosphate-sugar epimerase